MTTKEVPQKRIFKKRFGRRVFLIMTITLFLSGILTGGLGFWLNYKTTQKGKINRGKELILSLAQNSDVSIVSKDDTFIKPVMARLTKLNTIIGTAIYSNDGNILFSKYKDSNPFPSAVKLDNNSELGKITQKSLDGNIQLLITPVFGVRYSTDKISFGSTSKEKQKNILLGYAAIKVSLDLTMQEKKEAAITGLLLFLAVFILGTALSYGAAGKITRPISRIFRGVQRFSSGDHSARIEIDTNDEMGQIADSFNHLAKNLSQRMNELEQWGKLLEEKVHQRTFEIIASRKIINRLISPLSGNFVDWSNIVEEINQNSGSISCFLYQKYEDGEFKLLGESGETSIRDKFPPTLEDAIVSKSFDSKENPVIATWFPLFAHKFEEGQIILVYNENKFQKVVVDQILPALTITLSNIRSFRKLNQITVSLEEKTERLEVQHAELIAQKEKIEETSRLKSEFLANVSHELRTPINAIIGYSDMLLAGFYGEINPEQNESVGAIEESGRNLLNLINTILDHSRMEAGKLPVHVENIPDLRETILAVINRNQSITKDRPYNITSSLPQFAVPCKTDGGKIQQILTNLLSNAVKFTSEGEVEVVLETQRDHINLMVKDTGIGIDKKDQELIFEEFKQVDGSSTRTAGGTGLGLSVSRSMSKIIGGTLSVQSSSTKGSTFILSFPRTMPET